MKAETAVACLLQQQGFEIIDRNWKTRQCEIDIVAQNNDAVFFVEVKYRRVPSQGDGFEYITDKKQKQMAYAAQVWCHSYEWDGDYRLMGASVSGEECEYVEIIELG